MRIIGDSTVVLETSGREFYAHMGILGLQADVSGLDDDRLFDGFDGVIYAASVCAVDLDEEPFTAEERKEVAEFMVRRWRVWGGL